MSEILVRLPEADNPALTARILGFDAPYTPQSMLEMAAAFEVISRQRDLPGREYWRADLYSRWAFMCATRMETDGHGSLANIGPFQTVSYQPGDLVKLRQGAEIESTKDSLRRVLKRAYAVKVHRVDNGYVDTTNHPRVVNSKIVWPGAGGYWCWTDINNVALVEKGRANHAV
jgi:hypothetical protein